MAFARARRLPAPTSRARASTSTPPGFAPVVPASRAAIAGTVLHGGAMRLYCPAVSGQFASGDVRAGTRRCPREGDKALGYSAYGSVAPRSHPREDTAASPGPRFIARTATLPPVSRGLTASPVAA